MFVSRKMLSNKNFYLSGFVKLGVCYVGIASIHTA